MTKRIAFRVHPNLLRERLGSELYRPPAALAQLVANSLDSDATTVAISVVRNALDAAIQLVIEDDGAGISPEELEGAFADVGSHSTRQNAKRETIGTKGIGRFAVFSLGYEARWRSVSKGVHGNVYQEWIMQADDPLAADLLATRDTSDATGTRLEISLQDKPEVQRVTAYEKTLRRELFNAFAGYLARYERDIRILVNGEAVTLEEYVEERRTEEIKDDGDVPAATLHHLLLGHNVTLDPPNQLVFAAHGTTITTKAISESSIADRKYLGLVDSRYLADLTDTGKGALVEFDERFQALNREVTRRATIFIEEKRGDRADDFLRRARGEEFYPFRGKEPATVVDRFRQTVYDNMLLAVEQTAGISDATTRQKRLIFQLTYRLMNSEEDLAEVLTEILGLDNEDIARLADVLRRTSLTSIIAVSQMLVDRLQFLKEVEELLYGRPAAHVKERTVLHKIIERHTWLFGEEFHLVSSDKSVGRIMKELKFLGVTSPEATDDESRIEVDDKGLRLIPDLYFAGTKKVEGPNYFQHLIVEMKAPTVRIARKHQTKLEDYAGAIVGNPAFGAWRHRFKFVLVSSDLSPKLSFQRGTPGLLSAPELAHPTELWAFRWSDLIDARKSELDFLYKEIDLSVEPDALSFLRKRVGDLLSDVADADAGP